MPVLRVTETVMAGDAATFVLNLAVFTGEAIWADALPVEWVADTVVLAIGVAAKV